MPTDPMPYIIAAALLGAAIGYLGAALITAGRHRRLYNRGWTAGREFARRNPDL